MAMMPPNAIFVKDTLVLLGFKTRYNAVKETSPPKLQYTPHFKTLINKLIKVRPIQRIFKEKLEETLKWGEPSYLTKYGSTVRMDWKEKNPEQFAVYFKCTSALVPTFKTIYKDKFKFEFKYF